MNLTPWKRKRDRELLLAQPATALARLRGEMDMLFDRFFGDPWASGNPEWPLGGRTGFPHTDLAESENEVTVTMELPGVDPKDVQIDIAGDILTVRGEKKHEQEEKRKNYHYVERQYGSFRRAVQLPRHLDVSKVEATYKDGVLTVAVPKVPGAQPKRVTVKST